MPTAGAASARRLDAGPRIFANLNQTWHERARERHPEWPVLPETAYLALAGATVELVRSMVYADRTDALPDLEDTVVALHLAVMAGPGRRRHKGGRAPPPASGRAPPGTAAGPGLAGGAALRDRRRAAREDLIEGIW